MATVREIVTRALRRVNVVDAGESAEAADADAALEALNEIMFGWISVGVDTNPSTLTLNDTFPLDQKHHGGVIAILGMRLAEDYDEDVTPALAKDARTGWNALQADYCLVEPMRQDTQLANMPSQRRWTY